MMILVGGIWIVTIIAWVLLSGNVHIERCRRTLVAQRQSAASYTARDAGLNPVEGARVGPE